jgi:TPR repeat protein
VAFLERACDGREMLGCLFLAEMLRDGRGGADADGLRTSELYMRACNSGVLEACPIP